MVHDSSRQESDGRERISVSEGELFGGAYIRCYNEAPKTITITKTKRVALLSNARPQTRLGQTSELDGAHCFKSLRIRVFFYNEHESDGLNECFLSYYRSH